MKELCNLIHTSIEYGKQTGYGMLIKTFLQSPPLLVLYAFFFIRWLSKKLSL